MMPDREKAIKALESCTAKPLRRKSDKYVVSLDVRFVNTIIALLKEQEAVTIKKTKEHGFGVYGGICPKCRNWIQSAHSFCGFCGQAVKWEC